MKVAVGCCSAAILSNCSFGVYDWRSSFRHGSCGVRTLGVAPRNADSLRTSRPTWERRDAHGATSFAAHELLPSTSREDLYTHGSNANRRSALCGIDDRRKVWRVVRRTTQLTPSSVFVGWKKQKSFAGPKTARKLCDPSMFYPDLSIMRPCAGVSHEDSVAMPRSRTTITERFTYRPFVEFAVQELTRRGDVSPLPLKEEFRNMVANDPTATIDNMAFFSPKLRNFRIASIETGSSMQVFTNSPNSEMKINHHVDCDDFEDTLQGRLSDDVRGKSSGKIEVLNVAGFARPEYDLPIFCADFFSVPNKNIIVLDLNPLYNTDSDIEYRERYFSKYIPLANKYTELLPWGDKLTGESLQFFSPLVLWTKAQTQDLSSYLYSAFQEYLVAWLNMVDTARPSVDALTIARNQEAQHRYISWRATKDPGRPLLEKLCGEELSERYIEEFLFTGLNTLGSKSFLDYFPEYRSADGTISKQRSMRGKLYERRPWDKYGSFSPNFESVGKSHVKQGFLSFHWGVQ